MITIRFRMRLETEMPMILLSPFEFGVVISN